MNLQSTFLISLLAPGIRLVQNLKFAEKFLLTFLLLLIPLTYASYYLLDDVHQPENIRFLLPAPIRSF